MVTLNYIVVRAIAQRVFFFFVYVVLLGVDKKKKMSFPRPKKQHSSTHVVHGIW